MDNETGLLRRGYRATPKGSIYIKGRGFGKRWCIRDDVFDFREGTPVTSEVIDINLTVNRS